jgi:hypothetical protein
LPSGTVQRPLNRRLAPEDANISEHGNVQVFGRVDDRMNDHESAPDEIETLDSATVDELSAAYEREEPFDLVEREHVAMLPKAFSTGEFDRRDAEWVVRWYYRRRSIPDADRRAAEERFLDNGYEAIVDALTGAAMATERGRKLDRLRSLTGVGIAVASAFLAFLDPDDYVPVGNREWTALYDAGELLDAPPPSFAASDYWRYLDAVSSVAERTDHDPWTVYRALWRLAD